MATISSAALAAPSEDKLGTWLGFTSATRIDDRWSFFGQGELRTWEALHNLNETLFRFAGLYDFSPKVRGAFGYVRVDTWPFEENRGLRKFYENRIYEELLFNNGVGKGKVVNRFRLEQRWITRDTGTEYSNRFRWYLKYQRPLGSETTGPAKWYVQVFNEVFVDFDTNGYWFNLIPYDKGLNQNRLYFGAGRKLTPMSNLNFGFLWQHRPNGDWYRLVLQYSYNFDLSKDDR